MSVKQFSETYLSQYYWQRGGLITSEQALLGATALDHTSVVTTLAATKKVVITIPVGWAAMELRFFGDISASADTDDVVQLYAEAGVDHFRHFAQLTIVIGTQDYGTLYHFHDGITPANEAWMTTPAEASPANNTFGSYIFNTHAHSRILVIASDKDCTTIGVDYKRA